MKCLPDIYPGLCNINPENSQALLETNLPTAYFVSEEVSSICSTYALVANIWAICGVRV